jgi:hypothetical protein
MSCDERKEWDKRNWGMVAWTDETTIKSHSNNYKPKTLKGEENSNQFIHHQSNKKFAVRFTSVIF